MGVLISGAIARPSRAADSGVREIQVPSIYRDGYERACALDPSLAEAYVRHTLQGDPLADAAVEALAPLSAHDIKRLMSAGMERNTKVLAEAPGALHDFFDTLDTAPAWFDHEAVLPGHRAFHEYMDLFIIGFIIVTLRNFNSLMSKVFFMTGQFTTRQGLQLIRKNIRYLAEMLMLPGALDRHGHGWKFSVRIRLVHARIRRQLRRSGQWDEAVFGVPISAANMGLTSANFSASLIQDVERLGADLDADARSSLMQIWRYASWLIGTPEVFLCDGDEADTAHLSRIAHLCEPLPDRKSVVITNATVRALPEVAGLTSDAARKTMVDHGYRVARVLLGDELADHYRFPGQRTTGFLAWMRLRYRFHKSACRYVPRTAQIWNGDPFVRLLDAAGIEDLLHRAPIEMEAAKSRAASVNVA